MKNIFTWKKINKDKLCSTLVNMSIWTEHYVTLLYVIHDIPYMSWYICTRFAHVMAYMYTRATLYMLWHICSHAVHVMAHMFTRRTRRGTYFHTLYMSWHICSHAVNVMAHMNKHCECHGIHVHMRCAVHVMICMYRSHILYISWHIYVHTLFIELLSNIMPLFG